MSRISFASIIVLAAVPGVVPIVAGCSSRALVGNEPGGGSPAQARAHATALAATDATTCAADGGRVRCWGDGTRGQLGDGTTASRATPAPVPGLDGIVALAGSGGDHFCALDGDGNAWCWGANDAGQLGDGSFGDSSTPVAVTTLAGRVAALAASGRHACALVQGGTVACWGANDRGQAGGDASVQSLPAIVGGLDGVRAITLRGDTSCALTRDNRVFCWGDLEGQPRRAPVAIDALSGARTLSVGRDAICGLDDTGHDGCVGHNRALVGSDANYVASLPVPGLPTPLDGLLLGDRHACARDGSGQLRCWGENESGQLGDGTSDPGDGEGADRLASPGLLPSALALGARHSCAADAAGIVYCWGGNDAGQLGDGSRGSHGHPLPIRRD